MYDRKAVIKNTDMSEEMQRDSVECATQALEKYNIEKDIAAHIKKEFDKKYNPTWHCIVGRNFGSYVTHETKHFIYFYLGQSTGDAIGFGFCGSDEKSSVIEVVFPSSTRALETTGTPVQAPSWCLRERHAVDIFGAALTPQGPGAEAGLSYCPRNFLDIELINVIESGMSQSSRRLKEIDVEDGFPLS
ncbi:hypothetical protein STEG23_033319, partial [Scotinomys teguina]